MRVARISRGLLAALLWALPACAQQWLPNAFSGWSGSPLTTYEPAALETIAGDDAVVLREYGVLRAERRTYTRGNDSLTLTLFHMQDPSAAYGAFLYLRGDQMIHADFAPLSAVSEGRALAAAGNLLLEATNTNPVAQAAEIKLLLSQLQQRAQAGPLPVLGRYLPAKGQIADSERYLLGPVALNRFLPIASGDWLGFSSGAEAQLARYRIEGRETTLVLANYPTPQLAQHWLEKLAENFQLNPKSSPTDSRPVIFARRAGAMVATVFGAGSWQQAEGLLQQIQVQTQITWNEPGFKATEPPFTSMLLTVFLGTGIIMLFCIVAGIAFGGFRLIIKLLFPHKVFDRPSQVEILQLGLSSKPIEAKDFY